MGMYVYRRSVDANLEKSVEVQSVAVEVDEELLVALRDFAQCAPDDMRRLGEEYDHVHFKDKCRMWRDAWPDIILIRQPGDDAPEAK
jgi:hypothetical protein